MIKKYVVIVCAVLFSGLIKAQGFSVGIVGNALSTWMFNKNITDDSKHQQYGLGIGFNGGLHVAYHFNDYVGIQLNVLYGLHPQAYTFNDSLNHVLTAFKSKNTLYTLDFPLLLYFELESGGYIEAGGQYSMINEVIYTLDGFGSGSVKDYYAKYNVAGIFGAGMNANLSGTLYLKIGFRAGYGFTDLKGVDAFAQDLNLISNYRFSNPTNSFFGGIHLTFMYKSEARGRHTGGSGKRRRY